MSKVIDISSKLTNKKPTLKLAEDKVFEIDNGKNTVLILNQKIETSDMNDLAVVDEVLEMLIGKEGLEYINEINPPFEDLQTIFIACMAGATGVDYETMNARFRESAEAE